jgi:DNA-directed RNA polymerase II subunit RPB7
VKFKALVFRPFRGEVLDGEVIHIDDNGFMIESGPFKSFISTMVYLFFIKRALTFSIENQGPVRL